MAGAARQVWRNEPPSWRQEGDALVVDTGKETDFWNNTFYGFKHGNGHFLATEVTGDFSVEVTFSADYAALYDQAGVMLRVDAENWLKTGIEFMDGVLQFSVVVTRDDQSDWSVMELAGDVSAPVTVRLTRHGEALRIQKRNPDRTWRLVRLAFLNMPETVEAGPMCCSPIADGLKVTFSRVAFGPAISRELHDQFVADDSLARPGVALRALPPS